MPLSDLVRNKLTNHRSRRTARVPFCNSGNERNKLSRDEVEELTVNVKSDRKWDEMCQHFYIQGIRRQPLMPRTRLECSWDYRSMAVIVWWGFSLPLMCRTNGIAWATGIRRRRFRSQRWMPLFLWTIGRSIEPRLTLGANFSFVNWKELTGGGTKFSSLFCRKFM